MATETLSKSQIRDAELETTHVKELGQNLIEVQKGVKVVVRREHMWREDQRKDGD